MIHLTGEALTIEDVVAVARHRIPVAPYSSEVVAQMEVSQRWIAETIASDQATVYGVNTGFGSLARVRIKPDDARRLSRNLILTCLVGVGEPLPIEVARAMLLLRANMFARGNSGIRPAVASLLIEMLNRGVTPWVPSKGSLGASGDLEPLAHIAVVMTRDESTDGGHSGQAHLDGALLSPAPRPARSQPPARPDCNSREPASAVGGQSAHRRRFGARAGRLQPPLRATGCWPGARHRRVSARALRGGAQRFVR